MEALDVSMSESDFVLNDGEVTVVADMTLVGALRAAASKEERDCEAGHHQDAKHDGSDSGVELNGAEGAADGSRASPERPGAGQPALQDYDGDGTSEGGSESSSVLSHTPARKKSSSASSSSASCSTPGPASHPRSRSAAAAASACASPPVPAPRPRERSAAARGSSCSRGRQGPQGPQGPQGAPADAALGLQTAARASSRAQRSAAGSASACLMTSSLTASMSASLTLGSSGGGQAGGNARGRGTTRAPSAPRPSPRGAAATMTTSTDDGRWPSTVQRPTTLSRARASSVAPLGDRKLTLTSSSSKNSVNSTNSASTPSPTVESKCEKFCTLPRRRRRRSVESVGGERVASASASSPSSRKVKVTLYHETGAQTALTVRDLDDLLEGKACRLRPVDAKEQRDEAVQADRDREDVVSHLLERRLKAVVDTLGFEHSGAPRPAAAAATAGPALARSPAGTSSITSTVPSPPREADSNVDHTAWLRTLELLEQRAAAVKKRDSLQRNEIGRLRYQVEQTERLRKRLQSQQEETEAETLEMQEFLQVEKTMLAESLKEAENEIQAKHKMVDSLSEELERQREECQHLVRISEQRRQENLMLQARVAALEQRSKESLLQQGAAVSGASVALSALSSRLDELAVQLEKSSLDKALSTITVEAEAVTTRTKEACRPLSLHLDNNFQTLDNVTEPELEEEGGGQRDAANTDIAESSRLVNSESIQNLSAAIFRRLQEEAVSSETNVMDDVPVHLVDQVLDIDSLVTRVLRAISDTVNKKKLLVSDESNIIINGARHEKMESVVNQKVEGHVDTSKPAHIPLLNGSNEGSCSDGKGLAVSGRVDMSLAPEPVTGAA